MWKDELKEFSDILLVLSIILVGAACSVSEQSTLTETLNEAQAPRSVQSNPVVQHLMPEFLSRTNSRNVSRLGALSGVGSSGSAPLYWKNSK